MYKITEVSGSALLMFTTGVGSTFIILSPQLKVGDI